MRPSATLMSFPRLLDRIGVIRVISGNSCGAGRICVRVFFGRSVRSSAARILSSRGPCGATRKEGAARCLTCSMCPSNPLFSAAGHSRSAKLEEADVPRRSQATSAGGEGGSPRGRCREVLASLPMSLLRAPPTPPNGGDDGNSARRCAVTSYRHQWLILRALALQSIPSRSTELARTAFLLGPAWRASARSRRALPDRARDREDGPSPLRDLDLRKGLRLIEEVAPFVGRRSTAPSPAATARGTRGAAGMLGALEAILAWVDFAAAPTSNANLHDYVGWYPPHSCMRCPVLGSMAGVVRHRGNDRWAPAL